MKFYSNDQLTKKIETRNNVKKTIRMISYPLIIILIVIVVYALFQRIVEKNSEVKLWGYKAFVVKTGSMEKTIGIGDLILERTANNESDLKIGDIVSVNTNNTTITHRIIKIEKNEQGKNVYTTKGDNNDSEDPEKVTYDKIVGIYVTKIPKIGELLLKFHSIEFIIIVVIITIIVHRFMCRKEDREIIRHEKREKIENEKK